MNKILFLSLLSLFFSLSFLQAQQSQQLLFKLSDQQVEQILTQPRTRLYHPGDKVRRKRRALVLASPVDTLPFGQKPQLAALAPGSYLLTWVKADRVYAELLTKSEIEDIQIIPESGRSLLFVKTQAQAADGLEVHYANKKLDFDEESAAYIIPGHKLRGLLKIKTARETRMLVYHRGDDVKEKKYFSYSATEGTMYENTQYFRRTYHGYILVNQPGYRPGDTLRFKALIFDRKGHPQTDAFDLYCSATGKPIATLLPQRPGLYLMDLPLKDSLGWKLDGRFNLRLRATTGKKHYVLDYVYFKYEDYELDESSFSIRTDKSVYEPGDSVQIFAQATDASGVPLPGGEVILEISFSNLGSDLPEELYLPLTLLKDTVSMNSQEKPVAVIPKDKTPNTTVTYRIKADYRASNNELKTEYTHFRIQPKKIPQRINYSWKNDTLLIDYQAERNVKGILTGRASSRYSYNNLAQFEREISFPYMLKTHPSISSYEVSVDGKSVVIHSPEPRISAEKYRRGDSVFFEINNPWKWPLSYEVKKGKKVLTKGNIEDSWQWEGISADAEALVLHYRFFHNGQPVTRQEVLMIAEGRLNLAVEQPARIEPGDSVDIQVTVTDDFGQRMPEVDLTAYAVNNRFPEDNAPGFYDNFHLQKVKYERENAWLDLPYFAANKRLKQHHIKDFALDTVDSYRMRYPDTVEFRYLPLADKDRMEFAPFIYEEGVQQPIQMLYMNEQLVYFGYASSIGPFSFHAFYDTVDLRIRAGKAEYQLKDVVFKKGFKTEISINPSHLPAFIRKVDRGDTLTHKELKQLNNSIFWLERSWQKETECYLWQLGTTTVLSQHPNIYYEGKQRYCIGPIQVSDMAFALRGQFGRYLRVQPGYSYRIGPTFIEMEELPVFDKHILKNGWSLSNQSMGRLALLPSEVVLEEREKVQQVNRAPFSLDGETGQIQFSIPNTYNMQVLVKTCDDPYNIWPMLSLDRQSFAVGCYDFIFRTNNGYTLERDEVWVKKDEIFVLKADSFYQHMKFDTLLNRMLSAGEQLVQREGNSYSINQIFKNGQATVKGKVANAAAAEVLFFSGNKLALHKRVNAQGEFEAKGLARGKYEIILIHPDYQLFWETKEVKEGLNEWQFPLEEMEHEELQSNLKQALQEAQSFQLLPGGSRVNGRVVELTDTPQFDLIFQRTDLPLEPENDFFQPYAYPARGRRIQWLKTSKLPTIIPFKEKENSYEVPWVLDPDFLSHFQEGNQGKCKDCVFGQVKDGSTGEPIEGAIVRIKGTNIGTFTDEQGLFYLKTQRTSGQLVVNFIGYQEQEVYFGRGQWMQVWLGEGVPLMFEEAVVTGYSVGGGRIGGGETKPLFSKRRTGGHWRVNPLTDMAQSSQKSRFTERQSLVDEQGRAMDEDKDGVPDLDEKEESLSLLVQHIGGIPAAYGDSIGGLMPAAPIDFGALRQDFRDNAYWRPDLLTDAQGQARIRVKMPDDITGWKTYVYAMNSKLQIGYHSGLIQSLRQLTARLSLPRFMVEGDSAMLIGRLINYGEETEVQTAFGLTDDDIRRHDTTVKDLLIEHFAVVAEVKPPLFGGELGAPFDTLKPRYLLIRRNGELDGEMRDIPIFPRGVLENEGAFFYLEGDTTVTFSPQAGEGPVELIARSNPLQLLLQDLDYLIRYPHDCNEQMASRLTAMRLARDTRLALQLPDDNRNDINQLKRRLHRAQNADGSWGWWPGNSGTLWMTAYVAASLQQNDPEDPKLASAFRFLQDSMAARYRAYNRPQMLTLLVRMAEMKANTDFGFFFNMIAIDTVQLSSYEELLLLRLQQLTGREYSLDRVRRARSQTAIGGHYWGRKGWRWYGGEVEQTLLAYKILRQHGGEEAALQRIRAYFFETRQRDGWRNTIESAAILGTLVPDLVEASKQPQAGAQLALTYGDGNRLISDWPARMTLDDYRSGSISIQKQGNAPIFVTIYQSRWERDPEPVDSLFSIQTSLRQNGESTPQLTTGQTAELIVELEVKKKASYLSLEVPVPAGCSYGDKGPSHYREVHREYRKEKVNIYFTSLPAGKYTFSIHLEPRYSGRYTLNPAKAEMMYEPVFFGRNGGRDVRID